MDQKYTVRNFSNIRLELKPETASSSCAALFIINFVGVVQVGVVSYKLIEVLLKYK